MQVPGPRPTGTSLYALVEAAVERGRRDTTPFDPTSSPLHRSAAFIVGAPRSGTTWLHQLLSLHPGIATSGELHAFDRGVGAVFDSHADPDPFLGPRAGFSAWVTREELVTLVRAFVDGTFLRLRDTQRPEAELVLDKTPNHPPHASRLAEVYPDGRFVHVIRDGRDAAASAHDLWSWSPLWATPGLAASHWRDAVRDVRQHLSDLDYLEVRYEELIQDPGTWLSRIFAHLELPIDEAFVAEAIAFGRTPVNLRPSQPEVGVRKWATMPADQEAQILEAAGDLLVELGYVDPSELGRGAEVRAGLSRLRGWVGRRRRDPLADASRERRRAVLAATRALSDAVRAGDAELAARVLAPDARLQVPGTADVTGSRPVAAALVERCAAARVDAVDADPDAAGIRWTTPDGHSELHTCVLGRGGISRVSVA